LEIVWIAFVGGAASFAHCMGMCGGFALHLAAGQSKMAALARQLPWHFGRITTYVFLGALAGFFGNMISLARWPWVRDVPGYLAGAVMIVMGASLLGLIPRRRTGDDEGLFASACRRFLVQPTPASALVLGLANGLLPCPITLAFLALAAQSGSVPMGMAVMAAMGVGTMWSLLLVGLSGHMLKTHLRRWGAVVIGIALIMLGSWTIMRKAGVLPMIGSHGPHTADCCEGGAGPSGTLPIEQPAVAAPDGEEGRTQ